MRETHQTRQTEKSRTFADRYGFMTKPLKVAQQRLHDLDNPRRLRNDIESLLRTYPEVEEIWPQGKTELWARLSDGRQVTIVITLEAKT